jgi:hypothetical protein
MNATKRTIKRSSRITIVRVRVWRGEARGRPPHGLPGGSRISYVGEKARGSRESKRQQMEFSK